MDLCGNAKVSVEKIFLFETAMTHSMWEGGGLINVYTVPSLKDSDICVLT